MRVDIRHALNASFHFDEEMFVQGRKIITEGVLAVKASNKQENFEAARQKLGEILHPLQVFVIILLVNFLKALFKKMIQKNLYGCLMSFCQLEGLLQSQ